MLIRHARRQEGPDPRLHVKDRQSQCLEKFAFPLIIRLVILCMVRSQPQENYCRDLISCRLLPMEDIAASKSRSAPDAKSTQIQRTV